MDRPCPLINKIAPEIRIYRYVFGLFLAATLFSAQELPMFLFPVEYARLGLYALIAAFLAAAWPALRLMRTPPSALLGVFASER